MKHSDTHATRKRGISRRTFTAGAAAAGFLAGTAPFNIIRAQAKSLKVGVLLPRSGIQAVDRPGLPARRRYHRRHPARI